MHSQTARRRAEILGEMSRIQSMETGTLCEMRRERGAGPARVYFNHQHWKDGANHSRYVKADEVEGLKRAIEGRQRFERLAGEFVEITVAQTREAQSESKKNSAGKSPGPSTRKPRAF